MELISTEPTAFLLIALVMSTLEIFKKLMKNCTNYKILQVFFLVGAGMFWGGLYECWSASSLAWEAFHSGADKGLLLAMEAGVTYGILSGIQKRRTVNGDYYDANGQPISTNTNLAENSGSKSQGT